MTTAITIQPAPTWLRELADARANYEELFGWPVSVQVGHRSLAVAVGHSVGAVIMPAGLGAEVHHELGIAMLGGPVLAHQDGSRWTFLTKPLPPIRSDLAGRLTMCEVVIAPHGSHVVIPPYLAIGAGAAEARRWIEPPVSSRPLPPPYAVISTVRRLTQDQTLAYAA